MGLGRGLGRVLVNQFEQSRRCSNSNMDNMRNRPSLQFACTKGMVDMATAADTASLLFVVSMCQSKWVGCRWLKYFFALT